MAKPPYESDYLQLTRSLRRARRDAQLTQVELAGRLDVPQSFVSNYERGVKTLDVIEFVAICAALNLDPAEQVSILRRKRTLRVRRNQSK